MAPLSRSWCPGRSRQPQKDELLYFAAMANKKSDSSSWDTYWQGAQSSAAYTSGETSHPLVLAFWKEYFATARKNNADLKVIDVASGNGAVVDSARNAFDGTLPDFTCLDVSASAIQMLEKQFPGVTGLTADAAHIPLDSYSFDLVTSQFGIEYAGVDAIFEAARLVSLGGELAFVLHSNPGVIHEECSTSLVAIDRLRRSRFLPLATRMFEAGFATLRGEDRKPYEIAGRKFRPAYRQIEQLLAKHGEGVASGMMLRLRDDISQMHERMPNYDREEVMTWLHRLDNELLGYRGRMTSMTKAAINQKSYHEICKKLSESGFSILGTEALRSPDASLQLAWTLVARRDSVIS